MSAVLDAIREQWEPDLRCPLCGEMNVPRRPRKVHIEAINYVTCDSCGKVGTLEQFTERQNHAEC
jgi:predicted RNA-binding Zn-ribbon protein involved in translation (DUF1610 family)